jgi:PAS domain S-box-containing protein
MTKNTSYEDIERELAELHNTIRRGCKEASLKKSLESMIEHIKKQTNELQKQKKETEERRDYFKTFFSDSPSPLALIDLNGKIMDLNPAFEGLTGWKKDELKGISIEAVHLKDEEREIREKLLHETITKGSTKGLEIYIRKKDGIEVLVFANATLLTEDGGKPKAILYSPIDVTRGYKTKTNISEAVFLWGKALARVGEGDLTARIDTKPLSGDLELVSEAINSIIESLEHNVRKIRDSESDLDNAVKIFSVVLNRVAQEGDLSARVDIEKLSSRHLLVGKDMNKMIESMEKHEEELRSSKEYTADLVRNIPVPMSVMNPAGKRIDTNLATEHFFKLKREQVLGAKIEELYAKEDAEKIRSTFETSKRVGLGACEATCLRSDGTTFPALLNFAPIKDREGNVINVLVTATNVAELRKREAELRQAVDSLAMVGSELEQIGRNIDSLIKSLKIT